MESPHPQALQRMRTTSGTISLNNTLDARGAIHKPVLGRHRSVSNTQADRLYQIALDQSGHPATTGVINPTSVGFQWLTPHPSPQPQGYPDVSVEPFPEWTVPTPPRSDSGVPSVSVDASEDAVTSAITASPELAFVDEPAVSSEMSSLGFLLPGQYGSGVLESEPTSYAMDPSYIPPVRGTQPQVTSGSSSIATTNSTSPSLYQSRMTPISNPDPRRSNGHPGMSDPSFTTPDYRRSAHPYDSPVTTADYSVAPSQTIPAVGSMGPSPASSPHLSGNPNGQMMPHYHQAMSRSPSMYDPTLYGQHAPYTSAPPPAAAPHAYTSAPPPPAHSMSYPPPFIGSSVNQVLEKPLGTGPGSIRVLNQRPKPQCWDHGCNGRQFSTFSNLLRHQREKSGTAAKSYCPKCGAEFTRTTARNGHLAHDKCTRNPVATGPVTGSRRPSDVK